MPSSTPIDASPRNVVKNVKDPAQSSDKENYVLKLSPRLKLPIYLNIYVSDAVFALKNVPFEAVTIINLPSNLEKDTTHRYSANSFKLHRLPMPRPGEVLGLVGTNGIGKSTALKVLAGKLKPNLGRFTNPPDWEEILTYFRGSELQNYFTKILEDDLKAIIKPQYVDQIPKAVKGNVTMLLNKKDETETKDKYCEEFELNHVLDRNVEVYMFDEPSSYLDVKQRLKAALYGEVGIFEIFFRQFF